MSGRLLPLKISIQNSVFYFDLKTDLSPQVNICAYIYIYQKVCICFSVCIWFSMAQIEVEKIYVRWLMLCQSSNWEDLPALKISIQNFIFHFDLNSDLSHHVNMCVYISQGVNQSTVTTKMKSVN